MVNSPTFPDLPPSVHLTLLVPELIWPEPGDRLTLGKLATPGFAWLAARGRFRRGERVAFEPALARLCKLDDAPFGLLRLLGEPAGEADDNIGGGTGGKAARTGHWLCADPVHLRFHHERIVLADAGAFELTTDESAALVAALNAEFADIGVFHAAEARRWYLRLHAASEHRAEPISTVAGRRIDGKLPDHNGQLSRWLNEVQMFLHGHPVNARREAAGKPAVNSLWLWGGGMLPASSEPVFSAVFGDNPLARGLAIAVGTPALPCPEGYAGLLAQTSGPRPLVVLDSLLPPVLYENGEDWREAWQKLDVAWFAPLRAALGDQVRQLEIVAPSIYGQLGWTLTGNDRWKFWRKPPTLADLAESLSEGNRS